MTRPTGPSGRRPDFIVIGAMKAGTTSLYHYLREHPQIYMPKVKELDFFVEESNWPRGVEWYEQQFAASDGALSVGEASTNYAKFPRYGGVPARMASVVPEAKLVYTVRDPLERIRSHYEHRVAIGAEREPMARALLENPIYVDYSRYARQIDQYLESYRPEQLLVLTAEALRHDRSRSMEKLYEFLDVDPAFVAPSLDQEFYQTDNRRTYPPMLWSARKLLKRYVPKSKQAKELVDSLVVRRKKAATSDQPTKVPAAPERGIPDDVRVALTEMLLPDVMSLRRFLGESFDCWGMCTGGRTGNTQNTEASGAE